MKRAGRVVTPGLLIAAFMLCGVLHVAAVSPVDTGHARHSEAAPYQEHFVQMTNTPWIKNFAAIFVGLAVGAPVVLVALAALLLSLPHKPLPEPALHPPGVTRWLSLKSLSPPWLVA